MLKKFYHKVVFIVIISLILFIIENVIKYSLINKIPDKGFYFFDLIQIGFFPNENIAFGLPLPQALTIILVIIILIFLSFLWWISLAKKETWKLLANSLIILGALSNLLDRLIFGYVIDYLNVLIWPVFNLADTMIVIGVLIYVFSEFKKKKPIRLTK